MKTAARLLLLSIFLAAFSAQAKSPPLLVSSSAAKANVLIMLDTSGSMGGTNINIATKGIKALVQDPELKQDVQFGLGVWASYAPGSILIPISSNGASEIASSIGGAWPCYGFRGVVRGRYIYQRTGCGTNVRACMQSADSYLRAKILPQAANQSCLKTIVIVVSDGYWYGHSQALATARKLNQDGVQTFVLGLRLPGLPAKPNCTPPIRHYGLRNYCELAEAGGTKDDSPVFANDTAGLVQELKYLIRRVLSSNFTGSAPVLQPAIDSGDRILQTAYKAMKDKQWKGFLRSYSMKIDGSLDKEEFESGSKLDGGQTPQATRNIWTMCDGLPASKNNFTVKNEGVLKYCLKNVVAPTPAPAAPKTYTFNYTGAVQTWTVPGPYSESIIKIEAWGAQGGDAGWYSHAASTGLGGKGGYATGLRAVNGGDVFNIYVGGQGTSSVGQRVSSRGLSFAGGWNGGGTGNQYGMTGGGGASDVRPAVSPTLSNRVIVAGGGGGAGNSQNSTRRSDGGAGGGTAGIQMPRSTQFYNRTAGQGGTQSTGNAPGVGADSRGNNLRGGGGGGYWGGKVGSNSTGGGGGSSYIGINSYFYPNHSTIAGDSAMPDPSNGGCMTGRSGDGLVVITTGVDAKQVINPPPCAQNQVKDYTDLINFVRGSDLADQDSDGNTAEDRWKLGDIVGSTPILVGPPSAQVSNEDAHKSYRSEAYYRFRHNYSGRLINSSKCGKSCARRDEMIYVGGNDGKLHAFYAEGNNAGRERWAFIPPSMLRRLPEMYKTGQNKVSSSIWGVDGSPQVKDVYLPNGGWRTVLVAGLGRGGNSFFALDITNPANPKHLFTIDNDTVDDKVHIWQGDRDYTSYDHASVVSEFDYTGLAQTWSTPRIVTLNQGSAQIPAVVLGSGYSMDPLATGHLYVVQLDSGANAGKLLKKKEIPRDSKTGWNSGVSAPLSVINFDVTKRATYTGSIAYFPTTDGRLFKFNLTGGTDQFKLTRLFDPESCLNKAGCPGRAFNGRFAFDAVTPAFGKDGVFRLFYGTGDQLEVNAVTTSPAKNRVYAIQDQDFPVWTKDDSPLQDVNLLNASKCQNAGSWKWPLPDANSKVTGKVAVGLNAVMFTRYRPPGSGSSCSAGTSFFTELDFTCGTQKQEIDLGEGVATGVAIGREKIYIGIGGSGGGGGGGPGQGKAVTEEAPQLLSVVPASKRVDEGVKIEHWREVVR